MPLNVQTIRWMDGLRKRLGVQGHVGSNLVDDVLPTITLDGKQNGEALFLREERRYSQWIQQNASVGNINQSWIYPNALSGVALVVERISLRSTAAVLFGWGIGGAVAAVGVNQGWDTRQIAALQAPAAVFGVSQPAGSGIVTILGQVLPNTERELQVVMFPQNVRQFMIATTTTNVASDIIIEWREFVPTDEEIRG